MAQRPRTRERHSLAAAGRCRAGEGRAQGDREGKLLSPERRREGLGGLVERSITGENLINELDRLAGQRGTYPTVLRCDNGPELACSAMADWAHGQVGLHFIPPGDPWRNGYVESFNSCIRDECLNINSFWSLAQARVIVSDWKHDYNHHRRPSALGCQPRCTARSCSPPFPVA